MKFFDPYFDLVDCPPNLRSFLLSELQSPKRYWHGVTHHALMLGAISLSDVRVGTTQGGTERLFSIQAIPLVKTLNFGAAKVLIWATLFHDIVYDATRADNEEMSASTAELWLAGRITEHELGIIKGLILASKKHDMAVENPITKSFLWMDLSVLWSDPVLYTFYAQGIRKEYLHVSNEDYRTHRPKVMTHLLEGCKGQITEDEYEAFARNVAWEIAAIENGAFDREKFDV